MCGVMHVRASAWETILQRFARFSGFQPFLKMQEKLRPIVTLRKSGVWSTFGSQICWISPTKLSHPSESWSVDSIASLDHPDHGTRIIDCANRSSAL
jgi:hypothetical protein